MFACPALCQKSLLEAVFFNFHLAKLLKNGQPLKKRTQQTCASASDKGSDDDGGGGAEHPYSTPCVHTRASVQTCRYAHMLTSIRLTEP